MIRPAGTRIVTTVPVCGADRVYPEGSLGVVLIPPSDATHAYRVRLGDDGEVSLLRRQFVELSVHQEPTRSDRQDELDDQDLRDAVILECVVGSRAYGLDHDGSDIDRRGVYLPPAKRHWSLYGVPEQLEHPRRDEVYWELQKFLILALKANPNILEVLYSPIVVRMTPVGEELLSLRHLFLSKLVYQTFGGYAQSQFNKMRRRQQKGEEPKRKHAMHLIRLLHVGIDVLKRRTLEVRVDRLEDGSALREGLLAIRDGAMPFDEVEAWRGRLSRGFEEAYRTTELADRPDYEAINAFLIRARSVAAGIERS